MMNRDVAEDVGKLIGKVLDVDDGQEGDCNGQKGV